MFGILNAAPAEGGGIFPSLEALQKHLTDRMEKDGYKIVKSRSHRAKVGGGDIATGNEVIRCDLVCDRGGRPYECRATKHKTSTKKTGCPWKAKAVLRKTLGGWLLTIVCDQHNHEPGTPEPPTPTEGSEAEDNHAEEEEDVGPRPDPETSAAIQTAGVSDAVLRLTGDTFHQFKLDYRKMPESDRLAVLAQLQLRIAAIYAIQNEEVQRAKRQAAQEKRHREIAEGRRGTDERNERQRQQRRAARQQGGQPVQQQLVQQQPLPQQPVMNPSPFYMNHTTETFLPVPGFDAPEPDDMAQHHPAKRIRGVMRRVDQDEATIQGQQ